MMPTRTRYRQEISCDFFRVELGETGTCDFTGIVSSIYDLTQPVTQRNLETQDGYLRLYGWTVGVSGGAGTLLRLRTDNVASIASISEDRLSLLQLNEGDALAEDFCFRYFDEFGTLVVHRNRQAGSYRRLAQYIEGLSGQRPLHFKYLVSTDAIRKLASMEIITRTEVKIAMPNNIGVFDDDNTGVAGSLHLMDHTGAATMTLTLSMGHSRQPLRESAKGFVMSILGRLGSDTEVARVRGRLPEHPEQITEVDLITDRMWERIPIEASERPTVEQRHQVIQQALQTAYERRRDEIQEQFAQTNA